MYRLYKITLKDDGTENAQVSPFDDEDIAEGNFEFEKGLAMETKKFTFLMLIDNIGRIHKNYIALLGEGTIKPRLFEVKTTESGEVAKSYTYTSTEDLSAEEALSADYFKRLGGAKKDTKVTATMLRGIGANGEQLEYSFWVRLPHDPAINSETQEQEQPQGE